MAFPGGYAGLPGQRQDNGGMSDSEVKMVKYMQMGMESCAVKSIMAGGAGFALGGMFGLFMASMAYDTPLSPQSQQATLSSMPVREQLRRGLRDMGSRSWSSAKNFGKIGAMFSLTECIIEGFRAKNDLYNSASSGAITGAILARNAGPQAMLLGGGGFALFSTAIDWYMRSESSSD